MKGAGIGPIWTFWEVSDSLTGYESPEKESPGLPAQNRRMVPPMGTMLHSTSAADLKSLTRGRRKVGTSERVHLTLTVGLFAACLANVALVCAWL